MIDLSLPNGPIRSTPARYANTTFRSQLEARWALFFDLLDIPWKFEPQGFAITIKKRSLPAIDGYVYDSFAYLPDFRIEYGGEGDYWWLEVKGRKPTKRELYKCDILARGLKQTVALLSGGFADLQAFIYPPHQHRPTDIVLRWLTGAKLTALEADRITRAYKQVSGEYFENAKRRPRRRKGHLRQLVVTLDR